MAAAPYILAKSLKEAHDFATNELGLARGTYRVVNSASTLTSVRYCDLYLLPGWDNRYDRFAMRGALKWTKMNVIDVFEMRLSAAEPVAEFPAPTEPAPAVEDGLKPAGVQLTLVADAPEEGAFVRGEEPASQEEVDTFFRDANREYAAAFPAPPVAESDSNMLESKPSGYDLDPAIYGAPIDRSAFPTGPEYVISNPEESQKKKRTRRKRCPQCSELIMPAEFDEHVGACQGAAQEF